MESPDRYWFLLVPDRKETSSTAGIFRFVSLHVTNLTESVDFYRDALNAKVVEKDKSYPGAYDLGNSAMLTFTGDDGMHVELVELEAGVSLERGEAFGRFAIETEDNAPMKISESISRYLDDAWEYLL